ncbi:hypothetical protein IWQ60_009324 [Tieghemiomyces parasiticus]|uniref:Transcriptional regulatory protein RXT2 N-terminal domain-containing protein n=1 Tax=Tieghemiomyces parasiticus TaxID=78921 RepID=A0A9W7ZTH0_9FUNG|nr:hypothetical protein IWQ60_009324 [Tieghemiomyces parasiticus]
MDATPIGLIPHNRGQKLKHGAERVHRGRRLWTQVTGDVTTSLATNSAERRALLESAGATAGDGDDYDPLDLTAISEAVLRPLAKDEYPLARSSVRWTLQQSNYLGVLASSLMDMIVQENQLNQRIRRFLAVLLGDAPRFPDGNSIEDQHTNPSTIDPESESAVAPGSSALEDGTDEVKTEADASLPTTTVADAATNGAQPSSSSTAPPPSWPPLVPASESPSTDPATAPDLNYPPDRTPLVLHALPNPADRTTLVRNVQRSLAQSDELIHRLHAIRNKLVLVQKQRTQVRRRLRFMAKRDGLPTNIRDSSAESESVYDAVITSP